MSSSMLGSSEPPSGGRYSARSKSTVTLTENHGRAGDDFALARSLEHLKAIIGLVGRGAGLDANACARL
eukprot:2245110-Pleurochrysis_carterae.AAC.1